MADALCGPSNALQNFQKHASTDRTLQQDRLTSRQGPAQQSLRTTPANVGLLDPEFEAFQAGHTPGPVLQERHHFNPHFQLHAQLPTAQAPALNPSWASDFQKLHISSPPPQQAHSLHSSSSRQAPVNSTSWHQDFMRQQNAPGPSQSHAMPMFGQSYGGPQMQNYSPYAYGQQSNSNSMSGTATNDPVFDDAAFERAFEKALELSHENMHAEETTGVSTQDMAAQEALDIAEKHEATPELKTPYTLPEQPAITQHDPVEHVQEEPTTREAPHDDEELAQTAGRLLESVADNTSQKFQESNFLALMRKLRDHEMRVEGDKMVEVNSNESGNNIHNAAPQPPA